MKGRDRGPPPAATAISHRAGDRRCRTTPAPPDTSDPRRSGSPPPRPGPTAARPAPPRGPAPPGGRQTPRGPTPRRQLTPRFSATAALPSACFRFQSRRISAR
ncbi:hypothetical protein GCM10010214_10660 [Streptomyces abikoensis]|nr:hypothetical protein GCM10010214_10660 [Streptomyces abikoensis]